MSKNFLVILLIGLIGMGIIGVSMMSSHSDCLFGKLGPCTADVLVMINAHFSAFQALSGGVLASLSLLSLIIISFVLVLSVFLLGYFGADFSFLKIRLLFLENSAKRYKEDICRWLAIHENSPSFALARR